ncbi:MAG: DUF4240 domain-containing protein [Planctomycetia bacterium]|nr:DUF4240 domain-containing protein [Planctomycetia bacterium]
MTLDEFWEHIHKSKRKDPDAHADNLSKRLAKLKPADILDFNHWWQVLKSEAYNWHLWGAAYLINGGCSDDGFIDFRSWLILQDRDIFQAAVSNPDTLADVVNPKMEERIRCECYPAMDAWFKATGTSQDQAGFAAWHDAGQARHPGRVPEHDMGEDWDFDNDEETRKRLPRLAKLYLDRS